MKKKTKKIWVDQGNDVEQDNVVAEIFIRTLKNKIYKDKAGLSKNVYFDVLDDVVDKYNNTYHQTIKMKAIDVKFGFHTEYNVCSNDKDPKFKIGDRVRISKYTNIFSKRHASNWSGEVFVIKKIKNVLPWTNCWNFV